MENLVTSMGEITEFNEKINSTFKEKREEIGRLSEIDNLLKKVSPSARILVMLAS